MILFLIINIYYQKLIKCQNYVLNLILGVCISNCFALSVLLTPNVKVANFFIPDKKSFQVHLWSVVA